MIDAREPINPIKSTALRSHRARERLLLTLHQQQVFILAPTTAVAVEAKTSQLLTQQ